MIIWKSKWVRRHKYNYLLYRVPGPWFTPPPKTLVKREVLSEVKISFWPKPQRLQTVTFGVHKKLMICTRSCLTARLCVLSRGSGAEHTSSLKTEAIHKDEVCYGYKITDLWNEISGLKYSSKKIVLMYPLAAWKWIYFVPVTNSSSIIPSVK